MRFFLKTLMITNIYPSRWRPVTATFVRDQVESLRVYVNVDVLMQSRASRRSFLSFGVRGVCRILTSDYDLIHAQYGFHSGLWPMLCGYRPLLVTFAGSDALVTPYVNKAYMLLQRRLVSYASHIIAVSNDIRENLVAKLNADPNNISVIPFGIDTERFRPESRLKARRRLGISSREKIALFIGRLTYAKGVDLIKHASSRLKQINFYLIGEGPFQWTASNCQFLGARNHSHIPHWINAADVLILPSRTEGTPLVILEALSSGTPVICSAVGGCPEVIEEGRTGMLLPMGDRESLTDALSASFDGFCFDTEAARKKMVLQYDLRVIASELYKLYRKLCSS
jgi:glycosyltransferase involved in cell wall biosynthesis